MNSDNLILRQTDYPPLVNKDDFLDNADFDSNMINIYDDLLSLCLTNGVIAYDISTEYDDSVINYATYSGKLWKFVNAVPASNVTPGTNELYWLEVFPTEMAHRKNSDTILDEGGTNEVTASEIRAFIDAGLTSTTNLSLSEQTDVSLKINSSTGSDVTLLGATETTAGLLISDDKQKLNQLSGINSGDQTLESLGAEATANKVIDFSVIDNITFPTTEAVANKITSDVVDLVDAQLTNYATTVQLATKENTITAGTTAQYWRGDKSWQTLDKTAVGLGNVANVDTTNASNISSGTLGTARMGTGTADATTYLRGDGSWQTPSAPYGVFGIANSSGQYTYYATFALAIASAVSGQTIEMFADITESTVTAITLKNGVNINGNGHTYSYTAATGNCFIDNGVAVTCQILNLKVSRTNYTSGSVYVQSSSSSDTDWNGSQVFVTASANDMFSVLGTLRNCWVKVTGNGTAITSAYGSSAKIYNCYGESTGSGTGLNCRTSTVVDSIGISSSGIGGFLDQSTASDSYFFSTTNYACHYGNIYSSTLVTVSGTAGRQTNCNNCTLISTSGTCAVNQSNIYQNCTLINSSGNVTSFAAEFHSCVLKVSTNSICAVSAPASFYNCSIQTLWNNSSGHALIQPGNVVNSYITVANSSANCLNSASALSVAYANNSFKGSTTPVNANITQSVTNTQDSQGNILL